MLSSGFTFHENTRHSEQMGFTRAQPKSGRLWLQAFFDLRPSAIAVYVVPLLSTT